MSEPPRPGPQRTVFRPSPLQQQTPPANPPARAALHPTQDNDIPRAPRREHDRNPLMTAASPLLVLLANVRSGQVQLPLQDLHARCVAQVEAFQSGLKGRLSEEEMRRAVYALVSTADDIALNIPGQAGEAAQWAARSLVVRYFKEAIGGDRFWRLVEEMVSRPREFQDLLELYHACMATGFEGRLRVEAGGRQSLADISERVFRALDHTRAVSLSELSPVWRGVEAPAARVGLWAPLAVAAAAGLVLLFVVYIVLRVVLAETGGDAMSALNALNPDAPLRLSRAGPFKPLPPGSQAQRIRTFLAPEVSQGLVVVIEDGATVRVRTTVGQLFESGSDQLVPERRALFQRIGLALNTEPGPIRVEGYTDSLRLRGLAFPDNDALSKARAETASDILRKSLVDAARVTAVGLGETQPVASNETPEGKAKNRRVEVVVDRRD